MANNKMCPHCGGEMFIATMTKGCMVKVKDSETNPGEFDYEFMKEGGNHTVELIKCVRCKNEVKAEELIVGVPCKECGHIVSPNDIDENGLCNVCKVQKERAEIANASREDLIRMLLEAEKRSNPVVAKMEKEIEKAEQVKETIDTNTEKEKSEDDSKTTSKPKRQKERKSSKKSDAVDVEEIKDTDTNPEVADASSEKAVEDIANSQDAPFPDVPEGAMNPPTEEAVVSENTETPSEISAPTEEVVGTEAFKMFEDSEEPF